MIATSCTTRHIKPASKSFQKAQAIGDWLFPSEFIFSTSEYGFSIKGDGQGIRKRNNSDVKTFVLTKESQDMLKNFQFLERGNDLVFLYEITNDSLDAGWGEIVEIDQNSLNISWRQNIPAFNVGEPLVENDYVYLTGIGYIAKLTLGSGKIIWQHDSLYDQKSQHFNSFRTPRIVADTALFLESPDEVKSAKTIRVHRVTGKILSIQ